MRRRRAGTSYVWLVCGTAVLLLDAGGALAARWRGVDARALVPVAFMLYFCAGVGGGRIAGVLAGGVAGAITALVDVTLGRALAAALGAPPGGPPLGVAPSLVVGLGTVVTGAGLGLAGGVLGKVVHSHLIGSPES